MTDKDSEISAVVVRERSRLGNFIRKRIGDPAEAEDILQDVFYEFVEEYRCPSPSNRPVPGCSRWHATGSSTASGRRKKCR